MKKKMILSVILSLMTIMFTAVVAMATNVSQTTVLGGAVTEVVATGTQVKEGDVLLTVETIGGPMVAARATVAGTVQSVSVQKGANVEVGQEVAVINDGK